MAVTEETPITSALANGVTTVFPYGWTLLSAADMVVQGTIGGVTTVYSSSSYSISGIGSSSGSVTFVAAPANGTIITMYRDTALLRETDYQDNGDLLADTVNLDFDRLWMAMQDILTGGKAAPSTLRVPNGELVNQLPNAASRAGYFLGFDGAGQPSLLIATSGTAAALAADLATSTNPTKGAKLVGSRRRLTNAISTTADDRLEWQYFNAKEWGVTLNNSTDDSTAWANLLADLPSSNFVLVIPPGTSLVNQSTVNGIKFNGKSNFAIFANGATIKVKNGEAVTGNHEILFFNNCQDAAIYGLTVDGNRANRTPVEVGAHSIVIADSCARLTFRDVVSKNAVVDGWIVYTTVPGTQATYPTDCVVENCVADNCWRNGLSIIDSVRFTVRGGRYVNTNGTAPQSGIDIEPDASSTFGNTDCVVEFATLSGNTGYGLQSGGVSTGANTRLTLRALRGASNTQGFLNIGSGTDVLVEAPRVGPHSACTRSIIDFGSLVTNPTLIDATFDAITAGATKSLVYVHASVAGRPTIRGLKSNSSTSKILDINKGADISAISSVGCMTDAIIVGAGVRSVLRDIDITSCTGRGIYTAAADTEIDGATLVDCASTTASVQFDTTATGGVAENIDIVQTSSIPVGAVGIYWNAVPRRMRNVTARSAGTDYTATTISTFGAGVAGSKVFDCIPHPLAGSVTFNPGAIAAGGVNGTNITVTGAELATATKHDEVLIFAATDYTNLVMGAFITGANTVRVNFANNSGGGITPASATLYAEVHKR